MQFLSSALAVLFVNVAYAQAPAEVSPPPVAPKRVSSEAELGIAVVSGNAESETFTGKDTTTFAIDAKNKLSWTGRYMRTTAGSVESAKNWDTALRFERLFKPSPLSAYVSYGLESDIYAGYVQRNNADLGLKFDLTRTTPTVWFVETGYRNTQTISRNVAGTQSSDLLRVYSELAQAISKTSSFKYWIEYLPTFEDFGKYRINSELSLLSQLSGTFSLKTSYLVKHQSELAPPTNKYTDSFLTTALVAKF